MLLLALAVQLGAESTSSTSSHTSSTLEPIVLATNKMLEPVVMDSVVAHDFIELGDLVAFEPRAGYGRGAHFRRGGCRLSSQRRGVGCRRGDCPPGLAVVLVQAPALVSA